MYDDDEGDKYWDRRGADSAWYEKLREDEEKKRLEKEQIRLEKIHAKGEYIVPDEFEPEIYITYKDKTISDKTNKTYDDYDAKKLYYYMLSLRQYYADVTYLFYKKYNPEMLKSLSAYTLSQVSGNKLEYDEINYNIDISANNKKRHISNEEELINQREEFYKYQTHHPRTIQALFNKKTTFLVLQQRGIEAKLMNYMYNAGFYVDLGIKPTKEVKEMLNKSDEELQDFYQLPIVKEILEEKTSKIKKLPDRKEFFIKCRKTKKSLSRLQQLLYPKDTNLTNYELYKEAQYIKVLRDVINKSLKIIDKVIDDAELAEIDDYYHGVDVFKKD